MQISVARVAFVLWVACWAAALPSGSAGLLPSLFGSSKRAPVSSPLEVMVPHLTPSYADPWNPQSLTDADPWRDSPTADEVAAADPTTYKPRLTASSNQVCGGLSLGDLPWKTGSKTDGFVRMGKRAAPGKPGKRADMLACLADINNCGMGAGKYALGTKALKNLKRQTPLKIGGMEKLKSCAIVGNSGHILDGNYGKAIDNHEMVVRFNTLPTSGYTKKVGVRTTFRFLNHARSFATCHAPGHVLPEYNTSVPHNNELKGFILWHPNEREKAKACLDKRFANRLKVIALSKRLTIDMRIMMSYVRTEAKALGVKGMKSSMPKELTSGAHAILMLTRMCKKVNVFGISSFHQVKQKVGVNQHYQYSGRENLRTSGQKYHDWSLESFAWKLFHAAGYVTVCSA